MFGMTPKARAEAIADAANEWKSGESGDALRNRVARLALQHIDQAIEEALELESEEKDYT